MAILLPKALSDSLKKLTMQNLTITKLIIFMDQRLDDFSAITYRPILSQDGMDLIKSFPLFQQDCDTVYLYRNGRSYIRSSAAIRCLLYLKWYWKIWFYIFWLIPLPIRDIVYRIVGFGG